MKKSTSKNTPPRSWRDIQKNNRRFKDTEAARRRRWMMALRAGVGLVAVLMLGVIGAGGVYWWNGQDEAVARQMDAGHRIETLAWNSDGVLHREWFYRNFPEVLATSMSRIDIHQLKHRLEFHGQIEEAHLTLVFPDTLEVELREREPILRARVRGEDGQAEIVLIARDGTVFRGSGYPRETLRRLPGLTGVRLRHDGRRYLPVEDIGPIADLLDDARETMPEAYRAWSHVSMEQYQGDSVRPVRLIEVVRRDGGSLVFAPGQYREQLGRLKNILTVSERRDMGRPQRVDLSFRDEAVVQY